MKYFIITAIVAVTCVVLLGYIFFKPAMRVQSSDNKKGIEQPSSDELKSINSRLDKLDKEVAEIIDAFNKQSLFVQKLKEDSLSDSARVINLERKFNEAIANVQTFLANNKELSDVSGQPPVAELEQVEQIDEGAEQPDSSLSPTYKSEIFKDPEFDKEFRDKVSEVVKNIQKKEWQDQLKRIQKQLQQTMAKNADDFAKKQFLNDYQKQELNKALFERSNKVLDLFSKLHDNKISSAVFVSKRNAYRNESNDKIKQILLPEQYKQYSKTEPSLSKTMMDILRPEVIPP